MGNSNFFILIKEFQKTDVDARVPKDGTPGKIRTCDPLIRSQILYPAELRVHIAKGES